MPYFFDTNVIRYLSAGLAGQNLPKDQKSRVVVSAVSAIEVVSQIALSPQEALDAVNTFENWLDTDKAILLDWSETFVGEHVFGIPPKESVFDLLRQVLNVCYRASKPDARLVCDATRLRDFNEHAKQQKAQLFEQAVKALRQRALSQDELRAALPRDIVVSMRAKYGQQSNGAVTDAQIETALSAYIEYHTDLTARAVNNRKFNFFSRDHLNALFDAEQLAYLVDPSLTFITADRDFRCVGQSAQRTRIRIVEANDLRDPARVLGLLAREFKLSALPPAAERVISHEEIALHAYYHWERRGRPFGSPDVDWYWAIEDLKRV
jgi:hypothetical protein